MRLVLLLILMCEGWLSKFERNEDTMPVVRVTLDPPRKPHALVAEVLSKLEQERISMEQAAFEKLESEFDKQLGESKEKIQTVVTNALKVLQDQATLDAVVAGAAGSGAGASSFLEVKSEGITDTIKNQLSNMAVPSLNVELVDVFSPDTKIEQKVRQIEQKLNSKETELFDKGLKIFQNITIIFVDETKKNLQVQLNQFMVDVTAVSKSVSKHTSPRFLQMPPTQDDLGSPPTDLGVSPNNFVPPDTFVPINDAKTLFSDQPLDSHFVSSVDLSGGYPIDSAAAFFSFLETESAPMGLSAQQLNVAVGESEQSYPTISDVVDTFVSKRDAAERLHRAKMLQMAQKLMRAQLEILKDILHYEVAKSLSLLGGTATGLKLAST